MNPKKLARYPLSVEIQVSFQRDHLRKALQAIVEYSEPSTGAVKMSEEEVRAAYRKLKEIALDALITVPELS